MGMRLVPLLLEKHFENVIIAVFKGKVSGKDSYQMILPLELS